jgi:hypothetical protein
MIKLVDLLNKTILFEMAYERKHALNRLDSLSHQISTHILKLIIFNNSSNFNHWLGELNSWLNQVDDIRLKPNNKKLNKQDYLKYLKELYLENEDQVQKNIQKLKKLYPNEQVSIDDSTKVTNKLNNLINKICIELAADKFYPLTDLEFNFNT